MGNDIVVTREQIIDIIRAEKIKPSDLFERESLDSDPVVTGLTKAHVEEKIGGEYRRRKVAEERLEKLQGELGAKESDLIKQIEGFKINAAKSQLGPLLDKQRVERKLDDRQLKFIQGRLSRFTPAKPEEVEKEFNAHLDGEIDEYGKLARDVFGIESKKPDGEVKSTGAEPSGIKPAATDNKYLDPARNPFIRLD